MTDHRPPDLDLGDDHRLWFHGWGPDRILNPRYADLPDITRWGAVIEHTDPNGKPCASGITFDTPEVRAVLDRAADPGLSKPRWTVESWEPLTLSPSLLCKMPLPDGGTCNDHGFIRDGRWVRA